MSNETLENKRIYMPLIQAAEMQYQIPQDLLSKLIQQESAFQSDIISGARLSKAGAKGIAQFTPDTATKWAEKIGIPDGDKYKPEAQIKMAAAFLSDSIKKYQKNPNSGIASNAFVFAYAEYNAGARNIRRALDLASKGQPFISALPKETQQYVASLVNDTTSGKRIEKPSSATRRIFDNFNALESTLTGFKRLPKTAVPKMAKFLLDVGKGKIIKPERG
jgi:soluble lytic murein transglycosylase-like protein